QPLYLAVCRRQTAGERPAVGTEDSGTHPGIGCDEQGFEEAGVQFRRLDHLLCLHAGYRDGQRPRGGVFLLSATNALMGAIDPQDSAFKIGLIPSIWRVLS